VNGLALVPGKIALVAGIVLVGVGLIVWLSAGLQLRQAMGIVGLIASTAAGSLVLYRLAMVVDGATLSRLRIVDSPSIGPGMVLALLGALAAMAGSAVALLAGAAASAAASPPGTPAVPAEPTPPEPHGSDPDVSAARPAPAMPTDTTPIDSPADVPAREPAPESAVEAPSPSSR
jgi:hypothetical protein